MSKRCLVDLSICSAVDMTKSELKEVADWLREQARLLPKLAKIAGENRIERVFYK